MTVNVDKLKDEKEIFADSIIHSYNILKLHRLGYESIYNNVQFVTNKYRESINFIIMHLPYSKRPIAYWYDLIGYDAIGCHVQVLVKDMSVNRVYLLLTITFYPEHNKKIYEYALFWKDFDNNCHLVSPNGELHNCNSLYVSNLESSVYDEELVTLNRQYFCLPDEFIINGCHFMCTIYM